ncbi:MAG: GNAT family N-acetyltransferase [Candidatus Heimdallarchaeota archaeon]|nr:GNAT family N-acetyltransferase [Candidatus Heimdallarchaeota archaeon]
MTIKRLSEKDREKTKKLLFYCFYEPENWSWDSENWNKFFSLLKLNNSLGFFIDNELVSTYLIHDFHCFVRGDPMNFGGIAGVTTQPEFRRQGQVAKLHQEALKVMKENGQYLSALYPFKYSFYRKFGYEICCEASWIISKPANIKLPPDFKALPIKEISQKDSFEILKPLRKKVSQRYNLMRFQSSTVWEFHKFDKHSKVHLIEQQDEIVGYFISTLEKRSGEWNIRLTITDAVMANEQARLTLFNYIKKHGDQLADFKLVLYGDERIFDYFEELWLSKAEFHLCGSCMFRVVDVVKALNQLSFPQELDFIFSLQVLDKDAVWNQDIFEVKISEGKAEITKTNTKSTIDVKMDIRSFTQLFMGYRSIYDLIELNKVTICDEIIPLLNKAFPKIITRIMISF